MRKCPVKMLWCIDLFGSRLVCYPVIAGSEPAEGTPFNYPQQDSLLDLAWCLRLRSVDCRCVCPCVHATRVKSTIKGQYSLLNWCSPWNKRVLKSGVVRKFWLDKIFITVSGTLPMTQCRTLDRKLLIGFCMCVGTKHSWLFWFEPLLMNWWTV